MRIPSYSSVLGFSLLAGLLAAAVSLARNLPEKPARSAGEFRQVPLEPEENADNAMAKLAEGERVAEQDPAAAARFYQRWHAATEKLLTKPGANYRAWYAAGWARRRIGDDAGAGAAWERAAVLLRGLPPEQGTLYDLACTLALLGDTDGALTELGRAIDAGWDQRRYTRLDRDFESIREDPRFQALLGRMTPPRPRDGSRYLGS
ncbi:MAG: hypothetical protein IT437_08180 [Phycisphaerales bacterium]|nr:hypothetical protein [Phycisphaerales bacterium]